jgi:DNA-binding transcriptional regulator LsrR (DeoR family)
MLVKPLNHLWPFRDLKDLEVRVAPLELQGIHRPTELVRAAAVARLYYLENKSKSEIAEEFGISRFKVARILDQARDAGLVRIEIRPPAGIDDSLSESVRKTFGLRHVVVVAADGNDEVGLRSSLAHTATALLSEIVTEDDVVGIGYGRTLTIMAQTMDALARCPIVQLTGALLGVNRDENSVELVRQISRRNGGPAYPMYTPQVLPDAATAATLRKQPEVAETYRQFGNVTKAVVAVGSWKPPSSQLYDSLSEAERKALLKRGVAAEVCATLLDLQGNTVAPDFSERCISITGEQLQAIEDVIAVAGGPHKVAAVRSVILGGHAKSLITDTTLARALLETP